MSLIRWPITCVLALAIPTLLSASPTPPKSRTIEKGCRTLGVARLCFGPVDNNTPQDMSLFVAGKKTDAIIGGWDNFLPYELDRRNGVYRVKVGKQSTSDRQFFYYDEISFRRVGSRYLATKVEIASSHECDDRPDLRRIDQIDFRRGTITTIIDSAWTADGKRWRYVHPIKPKTSDIHRLSFGYIAEFLAETPATRRLCELYG